MAAPALTGAAAGGTGRAGIGIAVAGLLGFVVAEGGVAVLAETRSAERVPA